MHQACPVPIAAPLRSPNSGRHTVAMGHGARVPRRWHRNARRWSVGDGHRPGARRGVMHERSYSALCGTAYVYGTIPAGEHADQPGDHHPPTGHRPPVVVDTRHWYGQATQAGSAVDGTKGGITLSHPVPAHRPGRLGSIRTHGHSQTASWGAKQVEWSGGPTLERTEFEEVHG